MIVSSVAHGSAGASSNDRSALVPVGGTHVLIVADGAQGRQGGCAAGIAIAHVARYASRIANATSCAECWQALIAIDHEIHESRCGGLTTAVLIVVRDELLLGASVGDSEAHLFREHDIVDLTTAQPRRPFLGSGSADAAGLGPIRFDGRLLVATDGLFKYGNADDRERILRTASPLHAAKRLVDSVRLPSGRLHDDVTVCVLARREISG